MTVCVKKSCYSCSKIKFCKNKKKMLQQSCFVAAWFGLRFLLFFQMPILFSV